MYPLLIIKILNFLTDSPQKWKLDPKFSSTKNNFLFFIKTHQKKHSAASDLWEYPYSSFQENARTFSKILPLKKILNFKTKNEYEISTKTKNFKPEIKLIIENVLDELYLITKQTSKRC